MGDHADALPFEVLAYTVGVCPGGCSKGLSKTTPKVALWTTVRFSSSDARGPDAKAPQTHTHPNLTPPHRLSEVPGRCAFGFAGQGDCLAPCLRGRV